jgi:hypothetical protein
LTREQLIVFGFVVAAFLAGWIASFVVRRRAREPLELPVAPPLPPRPHVVEPISAAARAATPPLVEEVGAALRSDAANEGMMSVVRGEEGGALSALELDLADWGFTYGVAWARARERAPAGADDTVAQEALEAAERVFRAYTDGDDWTSRHRNGGPGSAPESRNGDEA